MATRRCEPNETFSVTLSGALNAVLGTASGTGTIMNDDAAAPPTVTASPATVTPGSVITTIVANGPGKPRDWAGLYPTGAPDTGFVAWQYFNGSATPPAAGMPSATLQFTAPTTPGSYNVRIYADDLMGIPAATSNTINVQALPALAVNGISVTEGQSGTTAATFTVTLSPVSTQTVTVSYATSNGTATAGSDYVAASGVLTFAPGVSTRPVSVTLNGDTTVEPNETFGITLSGATNAVLGTASGTGTITNDDTAAAPTVTVSPTTVTRGSIITATVGSGPGYPGDWVGLYPTNAPDTGYLAWQYLNGSMKRPSTGVTSATLSFTAPKPPGAYHIRLFTSNGANVRVATSPIITGPAAAPADGDGVVYDGHLQERDRGDGRQWARRYGRLGRTVSDECSRHGLPRVAVPRRIDEPSRDGGDQRHVELQRPGASGHL